MTKKDCVLLSLLILICSGCQTNNTDPELPNLTGEYLGQEPPGIIPVQFAADIIPSCEEWHWHGPPVFSPNGRELYWAAHFHDPDDPPISRILFMEMTDGIWSEPMELENSLPLHGTNPFLSTDGNRLYFYSVGTFLVMHRIDNGWSAPESLGQTFTTYPLGWQGTISENSTIYFTFQTESSVEIYLSRLSNGTYSEAERLGDAINSIYDDGSPCIAHDESFLIFTSNRPGGFGMSDLYISFRNQDNSWTEAINMGPAINSSQVDGWPEISPDGNYLFFVRNGMDIDDPFWVDIQIIENFRPEDS